MYGWRAKVALIVPENNVIMEHEFNKVAPEGVSVHSFRVYSELTGFERRREHVNQLTDVARKTLPLKPAVIVFASDSGSFFMGAGHDRILAEKIEKVTKVPATTTATSAVQGLRKLRLRRISVVTPFSKEINIRLHQFLNSNGIQTIDVHRLDTGFQEEPEISSEIVYAFTKQSCSKKAQGLYIGCTNLRTLQILEQIENDLGKPVISASQATIWASLRMAGVRESIKGYGSLLANH